jgi:hypothetical protein
VRLYAGGLSANTLSSSTTEGLTLKIELANPGAFVNTASNCALMSGATQVYSGTVAGLSSASTYASGIAAWTPAATGETRVYRFTYSVPATATSAIAGQTATASFTWEIQA